VSQIKQLWIAGCVKAGKSGNYAPYCRCVYTHLERHGALSTVAKANALAKALRRYERTGNPHDVPKYVLASIGACVSKLPPLDPLRGKGTLTKLPGLDHPRLPWPRQGG
jgi:hypothetical protein